MNTSPAPALLRVGAATTDNVSRQGCQKAIVKTSINVNADQAVIVENIPDAVINVVLHIQNGTLKSPPGISQFMAN